jgi:hypothetical protein
MMRMDITFASEEDIDLYLDIEYSKERGGDVVMEREVERE